MTSPLTLRLAELGDADLLLAWRNEPATRMSSFDTAEIAPDDHEQWFRARLASADTRIYIAEVDGEPVGQGRVDRRSELVGVISVIVEKGSRGRGIGRTLIATVSTRAARELDLEQIEAAIKLSNEGSLRAFRAAGYVDVADAVNASETVCVLRWPPPDMG